MTTKTTEKPDAVAKAVKKATKPKAQKKQAAKADQKNAQPQAKKERPINQKKIRKVEVRGKLYPVKEGSAVHEQDQITVTYITKRGENQATVKRGEFTKRLRHW